MFTNHVVPYSKVVAAARETAEKVCRGGGLTYRVIVTAMGGETASVAWGDGVATLNLPTIPASQMMARAEANQIVGLIAHECCHVMHSDWNAWVRAVHRGEAIKSLTNAIEDVRIEAREIKRRNLPGLQDALSDTCTMMHGKALAHAGERSQPIGAYMQDASYVIAMLGRAANGYAIPNLGNMAGDIATPWRPAIDYALATLPNLTSTTDSLALAEEVARMLQDARAKQPKAPQPPRPQPPQAGEGDAGEGDAGEGDAGEGDAGEGDAGEGDAGEGDAGQSSGESDAGQDAGEGDAEGESSGKGSGEGNAEGEGDDATEGAPAGQGNSGDGAGDGHGVDVGDHPWMDSSPSVDDIAKGKTFDLTGHHNAMGRAMLNQATNPDVRTIGGGMGGPSIAGEVLKNRIPRPAVLADSVSRLVLSEARCQHDHYLATGRFDRRAIGRATWGATNVFSRRSYAEGVETAVFLLVDGSGSMANDDRLPNACALAYHLGQAIDDAGARCMVAVFYSSNGPNASLRIAKDWQDSVDAARLASIGTVGTTPLSAAIVAACDLLATQDVDRRILLVLTDGKCDLGRDAVKDACALAGNMGIETGGIGIGGGTDCAGTFPVGVDLGAGAGGCTTEAGLRLLVDTLERERA